MSNTKKAISLNITKFPQNLLIPGINNEIEIHAINSSSKKENFKFDFDGENLKVILKTDNFKDNIEFGPGETKTINLQIEPTTDGYGKLNVNVHWLKIIEYTVKVPKIRETIQVDKANKILGKLALKITEKFEVFNPEEFIIDMNKDVIKQAEKQLKYFREKHQSVPSDDPKSSQILEKIDAYITQLAKGYLSMNNPQKALQLSRMLSNKNQQQELYINLIRAYGLKHIDPAIQIINNLPDLTRY
jgi:hypothetical protein